MTDRNKRSEILSPLWSVNLFIQVCKFIFIKLSWIDLISINLTISPVIFIGIISSIIFSSPSKIPIISINSQARCYRLRIYKVAMGVACVLEFPFQRKDIIREKNKEAWYYFFKYWIIFSTGSLLFTLRKIHCSYPLTTSEGERFACCENMVSRGPRPRLHPPPPW